MARPSLFVANNRNAFALAKFMGMDLIGEPVAKIFKLDPKDEIAIPLPIIGINAKRSRLDPGRIFGDMQGDLPIREISLIREPIIDFDFRLQGSHR
jgi:hypothetical protein